jgi:hypothetical protein
VPREEFENLIKTLAAYPEPFFEEEMIKLEFKKEELAEAIEESDNDVQAVVSLWQKRRKREEITLKEFVVTLLLLRRMERDIEAKGLEQAKEQLLEILSRVVDMRIDQVVSNASKLVEENGTQVLLGTDQCKKWKKEHNGSSEGCPGKFGCDKIGLILQVLKALGSYPMRNTAEQISWQNAGVDTIRIVIRILQAKDLSALDKILEELGPKSAITVDEKPQRAKQE